MRMFSQKQRSSSPFRQMKILFPKLHIEYSDWFKCALPPFAIFLDPSLIRQKINLPKNIFKGILSILYWNMSFISPLPVKPGGTIGLLCVCPSVCLSVPVCLSFCPIWFSTLFSSMLLRIDLKLSVYLYSDKLQIKFEFCYIWPKGTQVITY